MAAVAERIDFTVTVEKLDRLIHRIVAAVDPLQIIVFGSRARGEQRPGSDLDLAVIVEGDEESNPTLPDGLRDGIFMTMDMLVFSKERFDRFRPWINTVERQIDREGVRVYERGLESAHRDTLRRLC